ncbi:hypothetical protein H0H81_012531 [Sphagnurus paluster]|uniref:Uncharacterized protein n=1 Tax=Sphagnurus paluster TaxID=117069 RepID=A0A9P7FWI0_9AGAR|nr:hypothetical protein H0H81_012531 [Sphagnurus paluster]
MALLEQAHLRLHRWLEQDPVPVTNRLGQVLVPADVVKMQAAQTFPQVQPIYHNRSQSAVDAISPFLTEGGLSKLNVSGTDIFFAPPTKALSPNEAQNSLRRYLFDDFRFRKTFDVHQKMDK